MESSIINSLMNGFANNCQLENEIIFTWSVTESELDLLYLNCKLFIFPSISEGFGSPVLEAMTFGCPCIVANSSSLPDLVGDAAVKFNAIDSCDLGRKILDLISDSSKLAMLSKLSLKKSKKYSWSDVAQSATQALLGLSHSNKKRSSVTGEIQRLRKVRKKLAYISPFPPEKTGISKYSYDLIFSCLITMTFIVLLIIKL